MIGNIDLLNTGVKAEAPTTNVFFAPEGTYNLRVIEVAQWTPKTNASIKVKVKGQETGEILKDYVTYSTYLTLEIADGEYKGVRFRHYIQLHPNTMFQIKNVWFALGIENAKPADLQSLAINSIVKADVEVTQSKKLVTNKDTGLEEEVIREYNAIKKFYKREEKKVLAIDEIEEQLDEDLV